MHIIDVIETKAAGEKLSCEQLQFFIDALCDGTLPDYQTAALLMAIYIRGMCDEEAAELTRIMAASGDKMDLTAIAGVKVDKHSTGGIGDKTTLVLGPLVAACGGTVAKMSGRGLGFTGGTIDKAEAIPGFCTALSMDVFAKQVNEIGFALTGQTANVAPADKKLYALRDVTGTVASIPLIASSIMSKKLASGADKFLLDVKVGSGAFMKTEEEARHLAELMVAIGNKNGCETRAILTNMDRPLGKAVGNLLEVQEAVDVLCGRGPDDLTQVCLALAAEMLAMGGVLDGDVSACYQKAEKALYDGSAFAKFREFVVAQGGELAVLTEPELFYDAPACMELLAWKDGYLEVAKAEEIGRASVRLGAGRMTKGDTIDMTAGIVFEADFGDVVKKGDVLCRLYAKEAARFEEAMKILQQALVIWEDKPLQKPLLYGMVKEG